MTLLNEFGIVLSSFVKLRRSPPQPPRWRWCPRPRRRWWSQLRQLQHVHSTAVIAVRLVVAREMAANVTAKTITGPAATRHVSRSQSGVITTITGCTLPNPCGTVRFSPNPSLWQLPQITTTPRCGVWTPTRPRSTKDAQRTDMTAVQLVVARDAAASATGRTIIGLVVTRLACPTPTGKVPMDMDLGSTPVIPSGIAQISQLQTTLSPASETLWCREGPLVEAV